MLWLCLGFQCEVVFFAVVTISIWGRSHIQCAHHRALYCHIFLILFLSLCLISLAIMFYAYVRWKPYVSVWLWLSVLLFFVFFLWCFLASESKYTSKRPRMTERKWVDFEMDRKENDEKAAQEREREREGIERNEAKQHTGSMNNNKKKQHTPATHTNNLSQLNLIALEKEKKTEQHTTFCRCHCRQFEDD